MTQFRRSRWNRVRTIKSTLLWLSAWVALSIWTTLRTLNHCSHNLKWINHPLSHSLGLMCTMMLLATQEKRHKTSRSTWETSVWSETAWPTSTSNNLMLIRTSSRPNLEPQAPPRTWCNLSRMRLTTIASMRIKRCTWTQRTSTLTQVQVQIQDAITIMMECTNLTRLWKVWMQVNSTRESIP